MPLTRLLEHPSDTPSSTFLALLPCALWHISNHYSITPISWLLVLAKDLEFPSIFAL